MTLLELRQKIDVIDDQIMGLLAKRFQLMQAVKAAKASTGVVIADPTREASILNKTNAYAFAQQIATLYQLLIALSKELQQ